MLKEVFEFVKNPEYIQDENQDLGYRFRIFLKLLGLGLFFSLAIVIFNSIWEITGILENTKHASEKMFSEYGLPMLFLLVVVLAPLIEELLFRGPLGFFKSSKNF